MAASPIATSTPQGASKRCALRRSTTGPLMKARITDVNLLAASNSPAPTSAEVTGMRSASRVESVAVNTPSAPSGDHEEHDVERAWDPAPFSGRLRVADTRPHPRQRQRERHREEANQSVHDEHALRTDLGHDKSAEGEREDRPERAYRAVQPHTRAGPMAVAVGIRGIGQVDHAVGAAPHQSGDKK